MSKHSAMATTRCRYYQPHSFQTAHKVGRSVMPGSIAQGTQNPWQPWPNTSISIYPDSLAFRTFWKGADTLPGTESLLVHEEVQI